MKPALSGQSSVSHHSAEVAIDGEGRQPVTWETLMDCLDNTGHSTLASDLRRELCRAMKDGGPSRNRCMVSSTWMFNCDFQYTSGHSCKDIACLQL